MTHRNRVGSENRRVARVGSRPLDASAATHPNAHRACSFSFLDERVSTRRDVLDRHPPPRPGVGRPLAPSLGGRRCASSRSLASRRSRAPRRGASLVVAASASEVPPEYVTLANDLVDAAGAITTKYFRTKLDIDDKNDASPVTIADRSAEAAMRAMVKERFPSHAIFGEEEGIELGADGEQEWTWVFDPIDGTKSFITGKPLWGTLAALLRDGVPVLGVLDQPVLKERWVGVAGQTSTLNGEPISVRSCEAIGDAYMYATTPLMFEGDSAAPYARVAERSRCPCTDATATPTVSSPRGIATWWLRRTSNPTITWRWCPSSRARGGRSRIGRERSSGGRGSEDALASGDFQGEVCVAWRQSARPGHRRARRVNGDARAKPNREGYPRGMRADEPPSS